MTTRQTVAVAMSGGVDSSVAARLLVEGGQRAVGVHMRMSSLVTDSSSCHNYREAERDALETARALGIELEIIDNEELFEREVVRPFVEDYRRGLTPNPCVACNPRVKLRSILDWAAERGIDTVATGHYARILHNADTGRWELRRPVDRHKDQTYYLYALAQEQLARFRTPLGELTKDAVRQAAREAGLERAVGRAESQDICFAPGKDYREFLRARLGGQGDREADAAGEIVDEAGRVLGRHEGVHNYTIGQRRGLGIAAAEPLYVKAIRAAERQVVVAPAGGLLQPALETEPPVWGALPGLDAARRARVQIRYNASPCPALLSPLEGGALRVEFDEAQRAITPGQAAVFYDEANERVLGGGRIRAALDA